MTLITQSAAGTDDISITETSTPSQSAFLALQVTSSLFLELQQLQLNMFMLTGCMPSRKPVHLEGKRMLSMWSDSRRWQEGSTEAGMTNEDD